MAVSITKKELRSIVKESVHEALSQELMKLRALAVPSVSKREQRDIERLYGKPKCKVAKTVEIEA